MDSTYVIVAAGIVMAIVAILLFREFTRTQAKPVEVPEEDEEVTRLASSPVKRLPRLDQLVHEDEPLDLPSESKAVTLFEADATADETSAPHDLVFLAAAAQSDAGKHRRRNEDAFFTSTENGLYIVADGMGGYVGGDIASRIAVTSVAEAFEDAAPMSAADPTRPQRANELVSAIERANHAIRAAQEANPDNAGMGTTVIAARFARRRPRVYVGHVGDSRCYRMRGKDLRLLTVDHTLAAKGVGGPLGANLRRALGMADKVKVDLVVDRPRPGDRYLLCSDGLSKMLDDRELERVMGKDEVVEETVAELIASANAAGGRDNVTVVVVAVSEAVDHVRASL